MNVAFFSFLGAILKVCKYNPLSVLAKNAVLLRSHILCRVPHEQDTTVLRPSHNVASYCVALAQQAGSCTVPEKDIYTVQLCLPNPAGLLPLPSPGLNEGGDARTEHTGKRRDQKWPRKAMSHGPLSSQQIKEHRKLLLYQVKQLVHLTQYC